MRSLQNNPHCEKTHSGRYIADKENVRTGLRGKPTCVHIKFILFAYQQFVVFYACTCSPSFGHPLPSHDGTTHAPQPLFLTRTTFTTRRTLGEPALKSRLFLVRYYDP